MTVRNFLIEYMGLGQWLLVLLIAAAAAGLIQWATVAIVLFAVGVVTFLLFLYLRTDEFGPQ